ENKNAAMQRFLIGTSKDANTSKVMVYVEAINEAVCEVKITLYEGAETSSNGYWGQVNKHNKEQMIYEPRVYQEWFNSLQAEIERRKALLNESFAPSSFNLKISNILLYIHPFTSPLLVFD